LLIVDNGSTEPDALAYLAQLRGTSSIQIEVLRRAENASIAVALNMGLAHSTAPWICLLNNDIVVTKGWLEELLAIGQSHPEIGLLNPNSSEFDLRPKPGQTIEDVATACRSFRGQWVELAGCVGFCLFLPRRVRDRIGLLDETFQFMYYEDADYCMRAKHAGFLCAMAQGAYVYHHGSATIRRDPARAQRFEENKQRFYRKWALEEPRRIAWVLPDEPARTPREVTSDMRRLANEGHRLWVFSSEQGRAMVPRHLNIRVETSRRWLSLPRTVWRVVTKKKRFAQVIVSTAAEERLFRVLRPLHQGKVVRAER
jgi:GT2 family glycosyltransferase